jgi:hypothetical protein
VNSCACFTSPKYVPIHQWGLKLSFTRLQQRSRTDQFPTFITQIARKNYHLQCDDWWWYTRGTKTLMIGVEEKICLWNSESLRLSSLLSMHRSANIMVRFTFYYLCFSSLFFFNKLVKILFQINYSCLPFYSLQSSN